MQRNLLYILGREYEVELSDKLFLKAKIAKYNNTITIFASEERPRAYKPVLVNWLKNEARKVIANRADKICEMYGFKYNRIAIKDPSTIWGSCSSKKNLNFSWRLILAPQEVLDYVIIHELAHTKQMNHSKAFWSLVEECMPDYPKHRMWLKTNGKYMKSVI